MDTALQFLVTIPIYILVFFTIGVIFYYIDKKVKAHLSKPLQCVSCKETVPAGTPLNKGRLCAACFEKRKAKRLAHHR